MSTTSVPSHAASSHDTTTENGAITHSSSGDAIVNFYFGAVDGVDKARLRQLLDDAVKDNVLSALKLTFQARDARGGKGRRDIFQLASDHMLRDLTLAEHWTHNLKHLSEFGYFKDYFLVLEHLQQAKNPMFSEVRTRVVAHYAEVLTMDCCNAFGVDPANYAAMTLTGHRAPPKNKISISLAAKYAPRDGLHFDKRLGLVERLCKAMGMTPKAYRWMIADLCSILDVIEVKMSAGQWSDIAYAKVPSKAIVRYAKAFARHDESGWTSHKSRVRAGETKVNVAQACFPSMISKLRTGPADDDLELFVSEYIRTQGTAMSEVVIVADCSGSMQSGLSSIPPIDVCLALTLLAASNCQGEFRDKYIAFSNTSEVKQIKGTTWHDKINRLKNGPAIQNTNVQAAFDRVLEAMKGGSVIRAVIIVSDMQFDECGKKRTNFEEIDRRFQEAEIHRPVLVFWNVSAKCLDVPVKADEHGTILVAGYNPAIFELVISQPDNVSPRPFVDQIINSDRYDRITLGPTWDGTPPEWDGSMAEPSSGDNHSGFLTTANQN